MSKVTDTVLALAKPAAEAAGCEVWDVEYVKEAGAWYLRVYIDKAGGVSIDDCEAVSRALESGPSRRSAAMAYSILPSSSSRTGR